MGKHFQMYVKYKKQCFLTILLRIILLPNRISLVIRLLYEYYFRICFGISKYIY